MLKSYLLDAKGCGIGFIYHLSPVDNSKGPLAESAFLDRASGISLDFERLSDDTIDIDANTHSISGHFVSKDTGWTFGIGFVNADIDNLNLDTDQLSLTIGRYTSENTTVAFNWDSTEIGDGETRWTLTATVSR